MSEQKAVYTGTGKRKTAVARVILTPGNGTIVLNGRPFEEYFGRGYDRHLALQSLNVVGLLDSYDVRARLDGGGPSGQASALRHGIARALLEVDPELRGELKKAGHLARDARKVERKKAGLKKARKRPQFSKR